MARMSLEEIDRAMDKKKDLLHVYQTQDLSSEQINRAMDMGQLLYSLYDNQDLSSEQIDRAIETAECLSGDLSGLYRHNALSKEQIDKAIVKGEDLRDLYENQTLSKEQIDWAIDIVKHMDILFSNQTILPSHIDRAIDNGEALYFLYDLPSLSNEQRAVIRMKLDITPVIGDYEYPMWRSVSPSIWGDAVVILRDSVVHKIDMAPINDLIGVYSATTPFDLIKVKVADKGYYIKEGDFDYVYYIDKSGKEKKTKIGRILKNYPKLMADYGEAKPALKIVYKETKALSPLSENLEIVISNDPIDVAGKSTGKSWDSCEKIAATAPWGWPPNCGWCDDVKANNLIAYMRRVGEDEWIGRNIIRWCIREDDKRPDALIEKYYGNIRDPNLPLY